MSPCTCPAFRARTSVGPASNSISLTFPCLPAPCNAVADPSPAKRLVAKMSARSGCLWLICVARDWAMSFPPRRLVIGDEGHLRHRVVDDPHADSVHPTGREPGHEQMSSHTVQASCLHETCKEEPDGIIIRLQAGLHQLHATSKSRPRYTGCTASHHLRSRCPYSPLAWAHES